MGYHVLILFCLDDIVVFFALRAPRRACMRATSGNVTKKRKTRSARTGCEVKVSKV